MVKPLPVAAAAILSKVVIPLLLFVLILRYGCSRPSIFASISLRKVGLCCCVCVCVCVCVRACVRACGRAGERASVRACVRVSLFISSVFSSGCRASVYGLRLWHIRVFKLTRFFFSSSFHFWGYCVCFCVFWAGP